MDQGVPPISNKKPQNINTANNIYDIQEIKNGTAASIVSDEFKEMLDAANKSLSKRIILSRIAFISFLVTFIFPPSIIVAIVAFIARIICSSKEIINLRYSVDDEQAKAISENMSPLHKISKSKKIEVLSNFNKFSTNLLFCFQINRYLKI